MLMHPANLLILDEPTNHLDLTSKDVLLDALKAFEGTVLFVSHDRGFIEELADLVLELEAGTTPRLYFGDYRYYLEKKAALEADPALGEGAASLSSSSSQNPQQTASWEEEKARKARLRKLQRREEEITERLSGVSAGKKALEDTMARPENYSDGVKMKKLLAQLASLEKEATELNEEWLEIAEALSGGAD
jgi:ATP-binding cassette subfamily F protein 3